MAPTVTDGARGEEVPVLVTGDWVLEAPVVKIINKKVYMVKQTMLHVPKRGTSQLFYQKEQIL